MLEQGFPTWLHLPMPIWRGTFKVSNRAKNILMYHLFPNLYTYIKRILF